MGGRGGAITLTLKTRSGEGGEHVSKVHAAMRHSSVRMLSIEICPIRNTSGQRPQNLVPPSLESGTGDCYRRLGKEPCSGCAGSAGVRNLFAVFSLGYGVWGVGSRV